MLKTTREVQGFEKLGYDIHSWSSHSANYHPRNILVNKPADQSSRWSSGTNNQNQFIMLKLDYLSVVKSITFGKYHKVHVCNLKEFKVYGGLGPDSLVEILHSGLRNDSEAETFAVKYKTREVPFPCQYIKIVPLLAHGANFNFSIWHVELQGIDDEEIVNEIYRDFVSFRETEAIRYCLKHFRQRNLLDIFNGLVQNTQIRLEDPSLADLYHNIVVKGNFAEAEKIVEYGAQNNLFEEFILECKYKPIWRKISYQGEVPSARGGHQMCIDSDSGRIFMLGGWNGHIDLADLWIFHIASQTWRCVSKDTSKQGGPGSRSCHKICYDPDSKCIFVLGKYIDSESRPNVNLDCDFWAFDTITERWRRISSNTAAEGGPELIYDHQMALDNDRHVIYVFGGRLITTDSSVTYSGLYSYHIPSNRWQLIRPDNGTGDAGVQLRSRIGHSMLFNPIKRELYIFAGQRTKDYLSDFYIYHVDTDTVTELTCDYSKSGGPEAGFTQRATFDPTYNEIYVLSGLMKDKTSSNESVRSSFWVYNMAKNKWTKIYQNENTSIEYWEKMRDIEPCPRYAHQLVYDPNNRFLYLFGGNPGNAANPRMRLDDFWELGLSSEEILAQTKFEIRKQQFKEMCLAAARPGAGVSVAEALDFLHTKVAQVMNFDDEIQRKQFEDLAMWLISWKDIGVWGFKENEQMRFNLMMQQNGDDVDSNRQRILRSELYDTLLKFYPERMKEPTESLVDIIPIV